MPQYLFTILVSVGKTSAHTVGIDYLVQGLMGWNQGVSWVEFSSVGSRRKSASNFIHNRIQFLGVGGLRSQFPYGLSAAAAHISWLPTFFATWPPPSSRQQGTWNPSHALNLWPPFLQPAKEISLLFIGSYKTRPT